jgi:hypothetical protein
MIKIEDVLNTQLAQQRRPFQRQSNAGSIVPFADIFQ